MAKHHYAFDERPRSHESDDFTSSVSSIRYKQHKAGMEDIKIDEGTKPFDETTRSGHARSYFRRLLDSQRVESRGIEPVAIEDRTDRRAYLIVHCIPIYDRS